MNISLTGIKDSLSNAYHWTANKVGYVKGRTVTFFRTLPVQMQQDKRVAIGAFAAVNVVAFTVANLITGLIGKATRPDGQLEEKGVLGMKWLKEKHVKEVGLTGLGAALVLGTNYGFSRAVGYMLPPVAYVAIGAAYVATRLLFKAITSDKGNIPDDKGNPSGSTAASVTLTEEQKKAQIDEEAKKKEAEIQAQATNKVLTEEQKAEAQKAGVTLEAIEARAKLKIEQDRQAALEAEKQTAKEALEKQQELEKQKVSV